MVQHTMKLVIVESPTKAKTIGAILPKEYSVVSSYGHVRDLPKSTLGIDIEHDFTPRYVIPTRARKRVNELKKLALNAETVILATDEDREGEAIAWHLTHALGLTETNGSALNVERIAFHEITPRAIEEALSHPRAILMPLVFAQQARRILDRLVGYTLSPFLWKKVARGLSAGRVQSVAVRFIVERERERQAFTPQEYWTIDADLQKDSKGEGETFRATLIAKDGEPLEKFSLPNEEAARAVVEDLKEAEWRVSRIEEKQRTTMPPPPLKTSTLQQEAWRKLRFSAKQTMRIAQELYEGVEIDGTSRGLITYMRTDSLALADDFLSETQRALQTWFGHRYATGPKHYKTTTKGAQEAHEAIRPTDIERTPESLAGKLEPRALKLYELIWRRALASQMPPSRSKDTRVIIAARGKNHVWDFRTSGSIELFDGFRRVLPSDREDIRLPHLSEGESVSCEAITHNQHFTEPPPRFSEASLVKVLEEHGIGRPSTYAPIISTIQERGYVEKDREKRLLPTMLGFTVNDLLVEHFPQIVDISFTATMESELDDIAQGTREWTSVIREFWIPFEAHLHTKLQTVERARPKEIPTDETCERCGKPMVERFGRFGPFLACSGFPECRNTKPLKEHRTGIPCPLCEKGEIIPRRSKRGRTFFGCSTYPDCTFVLWDQPINERCPHCGSILVKTVRGLIRCSNRDCATRRKESETLPS
jgi:DNA topoisomerase-1